jgi:flagellar protein FliS
MTSALNAQRSQYNRDAILSATPIRLLTMLYDRLMLDLDRAARAHEGQAWPVFSENLLHAQDIVSELMSSLRVDLWDGGEGLLAIYVYVSKALIAANVGRDAAPLHESIALLEPLRQAWHEAAAQLPARLAPLAPAGGMLGVA